MNPSSQIATFVVFLMLGSTDNGDQKPANLASSPLQRREPEEHYKVRWWHTIKRVEKDYKDFASSPSSIP